MDCKLGPDGYWIAEIAADDEYDNIISTTTFQPDIELNVDCLKSKSEYRDLMNHYFNVSTLQYSDLFIPIYCDLVSSMILRSFTFITAYFVMTKRHILN